MAGCEQGVVLQLPMEVELEAPTLHPGKYLLPLVLYLYHFC